MKPLSDKEFKVWQDGIKHPHKNIGATTFESLLEIYIAEVELEEKTMFDRRNSLLLLKAQYFNDKHHYQVKTYLETNGKLFYEKGKELDIPNEYGTII